MKRVIRHIQDEEKTLLRRLAQVDSDYRDSYVHQIETLTEVEDWNDGTHSITVSADPQKEIRVEAIAADVDGGKIEIMLWAVHGKICLLELFRSDGSDLKRYPSAHQLSDIWDHKGDPRPSGW